jgi:hypothetical protein
MALARAMEILADEGLGPTGRAALARLKREIAVRAPRSAFEAGVRYKHHKAVIRHSRESVADPLRPLWVDPTDIERMIDKPRELSYHTGPGYIHGGDWDHNGRTRCVDEHPLYVGLAERFDDERDWADTEYAARAERGIERDGEYWGYTDLETFLEERTAYVEQLYQSIRSKGYRLNAKRDGDDAAVDENRHENTYYATVLEPVVAIDRDGELLFIDGFHRFAIARLLSIDLPVHVLVRHTRWQAIRDAIAREGGVPSDLAGHPDLQDLA